MPPSSQRAPRARLPRVAPDEGEGAAALAAAAEHALGPLTSLAPELEATVAELRELTVRLSEVGSDLHRFVASLEADPARMEAVEARLDLIAELRRRFAAPRSRICWSVVTQPLPSSRRSRAVSTPSPAAERPARRGPRNGTSGRRGAPGGA